MPRSFDVLKSRNYALLWWSGVVSDSGSWMQSVAIGALVTQLTHSAGWGGLVAGAPFLVSGLITPFGGVVADRHSRRLVILAASTALAVVATILAIVYATGNVSPEVLLGVVLVEGMLLAFIIPARGAMLPDLVPPEQVADAAALGNASFNLGRCIGPALAGAVIAWGSYTLVFVLNAISYVVVATALYFVKVPAMNEPAAGSIVARLKEGARAARSDVGCWSAIRLVALTAFFVSPFIALMPAVAQLVFKGTAVDTAHFTMAQGLGSVVGALALAPAVRRFGRHYTMVFLLVALPVSEIAYSVAPVKDLGILGAFLLGATYIAITVGMTVVIQLRASRQLRARVLALNFMTLSLMYPIGATVQGRLADAFGIRTVLFVAPSIYLAILAIIAIKSPSWFRSLDSRTDPDPVSA